MHRLPPTSERESRANCRVTAGFGIRFQREGREASVLVSPFQFGWPGGLSCRSARGFHLTGDLSTVPFGIHEPRVMGKADGRYLDSAWTVQ